MASAALNEIGPVTSSNGTTPSAIRVNDEAQSSKQDLPINAFERVDPELRAVLKKMPATATYNKKWKINVLTFLMSIPGPTLKGVKSTKAGKNGRLYFPARNKADRKRAGTALIWIHGGGRVMGSASGATESHVCSKLVHQLGIPVMSASYRLAPKHPFPAALDDLRDAYQWLAQYLSTGQNEQSDNGVKIAVAGESAGGGLATELCQRLLDESRGGDSSLPVPVAQLLVYPMLDDRTCVDERKVNGPSHFVWNNTSNQYGWSSYLGPDFKPGDVSIPAYAAAARRDDLSSLPPAWIMVGDLDLFRDECKAYADGLKDAGVGTEYVELRGAFHGFFVMGNRERFVVPVWESFVDFARRHLLLD